MTDQRIVIFANGDLPNRNRTRGLLRLNDFFVGADGGTYHILDLGLRPAAVIGDLDSFNPASLDGMQNAGVDVVRYPTDKDETDLELALAYALEKRPASILVVAALGGRLDQMLGNLALLSGDDFAGVNVRMDDGVEEVFFVRKQAEVQGKSGELVSLIPWGGPVTGVRTDGLRWPLSDETLYADKTRGISNRLIAETARVSIQSGLLLCIHRR
jgi:thiamine pyrophosphokinase